MTSEPPGTDPVLQSLTRLVAGYLDTAPESLPPDANLVHLGLGSLEVMRLVGRLRKARVPAEVRDLAADPTLAHWTRYLLTLRPAEDITAGLA
ncbi:phosphopantetheine-binding protein [Streptomyces sp. NPDC051162]|uniref:phosphopantetheine-binding protein n=1 Tax=unclassified Streptomyces TaxID=2593676 RepID=UPI00341DFCC1